MPAVFADDVYFGPVDVLSRFDIEAVEEIEFLSARDATTRHGTGYTGGIILVWLRKGFAPAP